MVFFIIGLGLFDERDITVRGLETVKRCARVYLEAYTSILQVPQERLEEFYGCKLTIADREMVESSADEMLRDADKVDVALLVVGDPLSATTHTDLVLRARECKIPVQVIHNASIMNSAGVCGLHLYRFGQTVTVPFFTETWRPDSFYDRIAQNKQHGMHTLALLDIKVKEQSMENLLRGRKVFEPPRYMSVAVACQQLLEIEEKRGEGVCPPHALAVGLARIGCENQKIAFGTLAELASFDMGPPLHSLVLVGDLHLMEAALLRVYMVEGSKAEAQLPKEDAPASASAS